MLIPQFFGAGIPALEIYIRIFTISGARDTSHPSQDVSTDVQTFSINTGSDTFRQTQRLLGGRCGGELVLRKAKRAGQRRRERRRA